MSQAPKTELSKEHLTGKHMFQCARQAFHLLTLLKQSDHPTAQAHVLTVEGLYMDLLIQSNNTKPPKNNV